MRFVDMLSAFLAGVVAIAALSLIVNPQAKTSEVIGSFGKAIADDINAAKSFS